MRRPGLFVGFVGGLSLMSFGLSADFTVESGDVLVVFVCIGGAELSDGSGTVNTVPAPFSFAYTALTATIGKETVIGCPENLA